ncbi:HAD-IA family hydrolase [Beijerinckia indica]|uniref:HAD-superfamily hydrolase, subfamily IA, variant 1 n=1 Tax=Beijerinckia indica subsp. indica (strain ATCC 9039 / DSM 1715 / NCIMB 8712) TaxID=395963 RepID=B2IK21_BEII9|nr:HAD-IA family hydrolase [Beijerinckia indica]ACB94953.1 HAD-superfamily hydrolase, subfamily IA, variant 1 [Beijerinckia indica subsp. indica ATCC 9039]
MLLNDTVSLRETGQNRRLVIFDVDGTLVDSQDFIVEAMRRAFAVHDLPIPERKQALSIVGLSLHEAFTVLVGPDAPIAGLVETYKEAWNAMRADPAYDDPFYPGARETLDAFAARTDLVLGIATGKSRRGVKHLLDRWNLHSHFETVQTSDDHPSKPAPDMVLAALAETGVEPADAFMIGDTAYDMEMACAAGVRPIGVAWGYHERAVLEAAGAERVVADFAEIEVLLGPTG